jgi:hypothetical protein
VRLDQAEVVDIGVDLMSQPGDLCAVCRFADHRHVSAVALERDVTDV